MASVPQVDGAKGGPPAREAGRAYKNVIVLTCGQSGSSVLTALIARAGFWVGDETTNVGYDTFENADLVDLDRKILEACGCDWGRLTMGPPVECMRGLPDRFGDGKARTFVEQCEAHRPWIWKDPRLCYTMHYWERYLDLSNCSFVVMGRDMRQAWAGHMIKAMGPMSFAAFKGIHQGLVDTAEAYLRERQRSRFFTTFEALMLEPERVIDELNEFLGTSLTMDDLRATYHGQLGRLRYSRLDYLHAWARYQAHRWILRDTARKNARIAGVR
jgi:hypothetical protein